MADPRHLKVLKRGVNAWNAWRDKNPDVRPDLRKADLEGMNLREAVLGRADLNGANLRRANFYDAHLAEADLRTACLQGANFAHAGLRGAILRGVDLRGVDLRGAILVKADLFWANLCGANLCGAILNGAELAKAELNGADLREAVLHRAELDGADLREAILVDADLNQASLIDARLDGADLTGAKLWETQRTGWSIKGVVCRRAYWDQDGWELTEYGEGEFERLFAERPRIVLRYPGGVSPVDLAMLPLIVERLEAQHRGSKLTIRSLQDEGDGASVTITVEDVEDRDAEVFQAEVGTLRGALVTAQERLLNEEKLRIWFEGKYQVLSQEVLPMLPMLLREALPRHEVHLGHVTGPVTIEGTAMSRDTYNVSGQAGAAGPGAQASGNTFQQNQAGGIDLPKLAEELGRLRVALRQKDDPEADEAVGEVAKAQKAAAKGDGSGALQHLKTAGKWTLGVAEKVGVPLAVEAMKRALP